MTSGRPSLPLEPAARLSVPANASAVPPTAPPPAQRHAFAEPPAKRNRLFNWLLLVLALLLATPPLVIDLARPHVNQPREALSLAVSIQTYQHHRGQPLSSDWLVPYFNHQQRLADSPALTWIHVAAFRLLPQTADVEDYVLVGRVISVAFALVLIAGAYWSGLSIGGLRTGLLSGLAAASFPLVVAEARLATSTIATAALVMLSVSSGLWAARPLRPSPGVIRQVIGWGTCGLAMGAAALTLGPGAIPIALLPLLIIILLTPGLVGHLLGLIAAGCLAALTVMPWTAFVHESDPDIWRWWGWEWINTTYWLDVQPQMLSKAMVQRLMFLALATLPWTLWLLGALLQPFSASSTGSRRRLFIGWSWWLTLLGLYLAAPAVGRDVYLLATLPAAGVLLALVFDQFAELSDAGRYPRLWRLLRWPQMLVLVTGSLAAGALLLGQDMLVEHQLLAQPLLADLGWPYALGALFILLALSALAIGTAIKHWPQRTLIYTALWTLALLGTFAMPLARGRLATCERRDEGHLLAITGQTPTFWLGPEVGDVDVDPILMLYANRELLPIKPTQLTEALRQHQTLYLLTPLSEDAPAPRAAVAADLPRSGLRLWRLHTP